MHRPPASPRIARSVTASLTALAMGAALGMASEYLSVRTAAAQPAQTTSVTRTGCLVPEDAFARASGLARVARGGETAQLVFTNLEGSTRAGQVFALTGEREQELLQHAHLVIELTGELEGTSTSSRTTPPASGVALPPQRSAPGNAGDGQSPRPPAADGRTPSGAAGVTPRGNAAHEPGDAAEALPGAGAVPPNAASPESTPDQVIAVGDLPRLNVRTFRVVGGACAESLMATAAAEPAPAGSTAAATAPVPPTRRTTLEQVTVNGCVIREASVDADAAATAPPGRLLLTRASRSEPRPVATGGAVPGSPPSGAGTGTVAPRAVQPGGATESTGPEALTFWLEGQQQELSALVDQRVSLQGTLRADSAAPEKPSAHSTTPSGTLVVESFRRIAGDCR